MLSLFYDGELPSPWKEKLEAHAAGCPQCGERLEQFRRLSGALAPSPEGPAGLAAYTAPLERVWRRLNAPVGHETPVRRRGWNRSVPVPLPLLAAAAALILAFGVFFVRSPRTVPPSGSSLAALEMQTMVPVSDLNGVLQ
jgi:anti-sigma factor RsiW